MERSHSGPFDRPGWTDPRPILASWRLLARVLSMQADAPDGWRYTPIKRIHQSCEINKQVQRVDVLECLGLATTIYHLGAIVSSSAATDIRRDWLVGLPDWARIMGPLGQLASWHCDILADPCRRKRKYKGRSAMTTSSVRQASVCSTRRRVSH